MRAGSWRSPWRWSLLRLGLYGTATDVARPTFGTTGCGYRIRARVGRVWIRGSHAGSASRRTGDCQPRASPPGSHRSGRRGSRSGSRSGSRNGPSTPLPRSTSILVIALGHLAFDDSWPFMIVAVVVILLRSGRHRDAGPPAEQCRAIAALLNAIRIRRPQPSATEDRREAAGEWHAEAMGVVGSPRNRVRLARSCRRSPSSPTPQHSGRHATRPASTSTRSSPLLAATVGTMASWVPLLPSGLGLVEAAIPAILHRFGAPLDDALAATLVYRAAGTLLPALVGGLAIVALRSHRDTLPIAAARGTA